MKLSHLLLPAIGLAAAPAAFAATPAAHTKTAPAAFAAAATGNAAFAAPRTAAIADGDNANCFEITSDSTCSLFNPVPFIGDDGVLRIPATAIIDGHTYTVNALDIFSEGTPPRPFPEKEAFVRYYEFLEEGIEFTVPAIVEGDDDDAYSLRTSVTTIEFPATIEHINLVRLADFPHATTYRVDPANATFYSLDGVLYTKRSHTLAACSSELEGQFVIPEGVEAIGEEAFSYCEALTAVSIPESVTTIGRCAFLECLSLTTVSLPKGLKVIDDEAFAGCYNLTSIDIPEGVTTIGGEAFSYCKALKSINIPNGVTAIGDYAFIGCDALTSIDIPNSVTTIGYHAFSGCGALTSIDIPEGVTTIGDCAFSGCDALTAINIPNSVTTIGEEAFRGCEALISINIPSSVTNIGNGAFYDCENLTSIDIPEGVTTIGDCAFSGCKALTNINVANDNPTYCSVDGALFSKDQKTLIQCPGAQQDTYCIPNSVTTIGDHAFSGCEALTAINIPNSVTTIGNHAFSGCEALTSIDIPNSVTTIGYHAFSGCGALTSINCRAQTPPTVKENPYSLFYYPSAVGTIHVPKGCAEAYRAAKFWNERTIVDDL